MADIIRAWLYRRWFFVRSIMNAAARAWLRTNDHEFMFNEARRELIRRRNKLLDAGIRPDDPQYPDLWDIIDPHTLKQRKTPHG